MEAGADMYYCNRSYDVVEMLAKEAIPVQVHMGLVPSISHWCGGLRAYGRTAEEAMRIHQTFKDFENAGAFACEIECGRGLFALNNKTSIVTISLGSERRRCHFLVCCGHLRRRRKPPKHAHAFGDVGPPAPSDSRRTRRCVKTV